MKIISLVIAAYNVDKYIEKCLNSCVQQNISDAIYEIIVVDDGSTDNTFSIANRYEKKYSNIKIIQQKNTGLGSARNTGIKNSQGKYIWFIDGDDFIEKNVLENITKTLESEQPDCLVLNYNITDEYGKMLQANVYKPFMDKEIENGAEYYKNNYQMSYSWIYIFKKEIYMKNNIFFKESINMQDSEILPKLLFYTNKLKFFKPAVYNYVQREDSFTNSTNGKKRYKYFQSIIEVKNSLQNFCLTIPNEKINLKIGIQNKLNSLHKVIFYHLIFFKYDKKDLRKNIELLKQNKLYPLQYKAKGKLKIVKIFMNIFPIFTKKIIDFIRL